MTTEEKNARITEINHRTGEMDYTTYNGNIEFHNLIKEREKLESK